MNPFGTQEQYPFDIPDKIKEIIDALERNKQEQQEPQASTDYVNNAVYQGTQSANAAWQQQQAQQQALQQQQAQQQALQQQQAQQQALQQQQAQQQQQFPQRPLSQLDVAFANQLIGNKETYGKANDYAKARAPQGADEATIQAIADEIRNTAHGDAENLRKIAAAAGVDTSPYGEGVTLDDARYNLKSRQIKEIADLMGGQGRYGRTADQYHQDTFYSLIRDGYSAREAKEIAGERAQRYQADRLGYLRNAYNVHGRDGNYTNDIGVGILDAIAQENPAVAKVYATAYKLPTNAQDRYETLEDKHLEHLFKKDDAQTNFLHNWELANKNLQDNVVLKHVGSQLDREEYAYKKDSDFVDFVRREKYTSEAERRQLFQRYNDYMAIGKTLGLSPEEQKQFGLSLLGIQPPKGGEKTSDKTIENVSKVFTVLDNAEKRLTEELETLQGTPAGNDKEKKKKIDEQIAGVQQQLNHVREQRNSLLGYAYTKLGIRGIGEQPEPETGNSIMEYSDDENVNTQTLQTLWQLSKGDMKTYTEYVDKWLTESKVTPHAKAQILAGLKPPK